LEIGYGYGSAREVIPAVEIVHPVPAQRLKRLVATGHELSWRLQFQTWARERCETQRIHPDDQAASRERSSHLDGAESELIVNSDHGAQYNQQAIREVERILKENLTAKN
jgi:hypothetical protein